MSSFSEIRKIFLDNLEKHAIKHFTLQQLVKHNLPRTFNHSTIEIHIVNNQIIDCEDSNTYCNLCLSHTSRRLDITNAELYDYAKAYLTLKQNSKSDSNEVKDILNEPIPYLLNNTQLAEYIQNYLLEDKITKYIDKVTQNINTIRSIYQKEPIEKISLENLSFIGLFKMYHVEFSDKPKVLFSDLFDIKVNNKDDVFIISRTGNSTYDINTSGCLIVQYKPNSPYKINKFILDLFVKYNKKDLRNIELPALTAEQISLLNIDPNALGYYGDSFMREFENILESMTGLCID